MPQVSGTVRHGDGSTASGRKVSGLASGAMGGMIGPVYSDQRGRFVLSWNSSTTTLAKLYVDGQEKLRDVSAGEIGDVSI